MRRRSAAGRSRAWRSWTRPPRPGGPRPPRQSFRRAPSRAHLGKCASLRSPHGLRTRQQRHASPWSPGRPAASARRRCARLQPPAFTPSPPRGASSAAEELAAEVGGDALELDVTDPASVDALAEALPEVDVVVHSAGGALGLEPVAEADEAKWLEMFETNVLGVERVTKALLPALERGGGGHIVVIGSVAGVEVYPGGAGYTAAKHAVNALTRTLRLELLGKPIRVTEIAPGLVETEFSLVRFEGDEEKAEKVYEGLRAAHRRGRRRNDRLRRHPPTAREHRLPGGQANRPGHSARRPPRRRRGYGSGSPALRSPPTSCRAGRAGRRRRGGTRRARSPR